MKNEHIYISSWKKDVDRIFSVGLSISVLGLIMLLGTCLGFHNIQEERREIVTIDSVCKSVLEQTFALQKLKEGKDTTELQGLRSKVDTLGIRLEILQHTLSNIKKQTEIRQNDIRQETNNIINKFNGWISWWILLLGIICGFAPLTLAYLNHKNSSEHIKLLNKNYDEKVAALDAKIKDIDNLSKRLKKEYEEQYKDLDKQKKQLYLMHSFVYAVTLTKAAKFQNMRCRDIIAEKLIRKIMEHSEQCINFSSLKKNETDSFYWVTASLEGFRLLVPFQRDRLRIRKINRLIQQLESISNDMYEGKELDMAKLSEAKRAMTAINSMYH